MAAKSPRYPFTPNERANRLNEKSGTAFLIAMCLDQQVRTENAFLGPFVLRQRIGTLDAHKIAGMRPAALDAAFSTSPAIHRYPRMMAKRVRDLCRVLADSYDGDGSRVMENVSDAQELYRRLRALPGFGDDKAQCAVRILGKYGHLKLRGWRGYASDDDLPWAYKRGKRT